PLAGLRLALEVVLETAARMVVAALHPAPAVEQLPAGCPVPSRCPEALVPQRTSRVQLGAATAALCQRRSSVVRRVPLLRKLRRMPQWVKQARTRQRHDGGRLRRLPDQA